MSPTIFHPALCCEAMASQLQKECSEHPDRFDCPDALIHAWPRDQSPESFQYGLVIHDGGSSTIAIHYCPWCGTCL